MARLTCISLLCSLLLLPAHVRATDSPVRASISPAFGYAPLTIKVEAFLPYDARNAFLCAAYERVEGEGPGPLFRSSCEPLGALARALYPFRWRALPEGTYLVWVALYRLDGQGRLTLTYSSPPFTVQSLEGLPQ